MNVFRIALDVAGARDWVAMEHGPDELEIQVVTERGRKQDVTVTGVEGWDGEAIAHVWSRGAQADNVRDLDDLLDGDRLPPIGGLRVVGGDIVVHAAIVDEGASRAAVERAIYYVAHAADDIERKVYGDKADTF